MCSLVMNPFSSDYIKAEKLSIRNVLTYLYTMYTGIQQRLVLHFIVLCVGEIKG